MNLRTKIWLTLAVALVGVIGPLFLIFTLILGDDFDRLAGELAKLHARRVAELVGHQQRALGLLATDWGEWDDAYAYLLDRDPEFIDSNLTDDINEATDTDLLLILDTRGERVVAAANTRPATQSEELLRRLTELLVTKGVNGVEREEPALGVLATPHGPLLFGASPVLTSEGEGPNRGVLVMARLLDPALIAQWRELSQGAFDIVPWSHVREALTPPEAEALLSRGEAVRKVGGEMVGYGRIIDYRGEPAYLIRAESQQAVYAQGRATLGVLSTLLFTALLLFAAMAIGLLERSVLSRLVRLDRAVAHVRQHEARGEEVAQVAAEGSDEVSRLAGTIDAMVADLAGSLHEKEVLLREIHHRVKNNMQVISSLLNMQADSVDDAGTRQALKESRDRVRSMALVHEKLYQSSGFARLDFGGYLRGLTAAIANANGSIAERVAIDYELEPLEVELDTAVYCGLVTNELISNAFEHAFPLNVPGRLRITLRREGERGVELEVGDDGAGLPEGLRIHGATTLGLRLITNLVERQLGGELTVESGPEGGATFRVRFTEPERDTP